MASLALNVITRGPAGDDPPDALRDPGFMAALSAALRPAILVRSDDPDLAWFIHATGGAQVIVIDAGDPAHSMAAALQGAAAAWLDSAGYRFTIEVRPA